MPSDNVDVRLRLRNARRFQAKNATAGRARAELASQSGPDIVKHEGGRYGTTTYRTALLGLIGGHFDDWQRTRATEIEALEQYGVSDNIEAPVSTGVGYVIPAEFIRETLMHKDLIEMRRKAEEAFAAREEEAATMDSVGSEPT